MAHSKQSSAPSRLRFPSVHRQRFNAWAMQPLRTPRPVFTSRAPRPVHPGERRAGTDKAGPPRTPSSNARDCKGPAGPNRRQNHMSLKNPLLAQPKPRPHQVTSPAELGEQGLPLFSFTQNPRFQTHKTSARTASPTFKLGDQLANRILTLTRGNAKTRCGVCLGAARTHDAIALQSQGKARFHGCCVEQPWPRFSAP
jgi:hypothetical protein